MKTLIFLLLIFPQLLLATENLETIVIVSIDALHPDAVVKENIPELWDLIEKSYITKKGLSINPPKTLLSHAAMFTGKTPQESGITNNSWKKGEKRISIPTIFNIASDAGFNTGFFYAKEKLGFLVNESVDYSKLSNIAPVHYGLEYLKNTEGKKFVFIHISGLDQTGPKYGWMSKEYLEELKYIGEDLRPLVDYLQKRKNILLIITSDHAGHDKIHGSNHPEDKKVPFIAYSDIIDYSFFSKIEPYNVTDLHFFIKNLLK